MAAVYRWLQMPQATAAASQAPSSSADDSYAGRTIRCDRISPMTQPHHVLRDGRADAVGMTFPADGEVCLC